MRLWPFHRKNEQRSITYGDVFGDPPRGTHAGVNVSQETSLRLTAVYSCVSLVSETIASLPLQTFRGAGSQRQPLEGPGWVTRPNPLQTRFTTVQALVASMLLDGNAYLYLL